MPTNKQLNSCIQLKETNYVFFLHFDKILAHKDITATPFSTMNLQLFSELPDVGHGATRLTPPISFPDSACIEIGGAEQPIKHIHYLTEQSVNSLRAITKLKTGIFILNHLHFPFLQFSSCLLVLIPLSTYPHSNLCAELTQVVKTPAYCIFQKVQTNGQRFKTPVKNHVIISLLNIGSINTGHHDLRPKADKAGVQLYYFISSGYS